MGSDTSPLEQPRQSNPSADDLTRIQGIGPVIERQLYDAGILTYAQLAALSSEQIARLIKNLPLLSVERIARQDWPGQARALAAESALLDLDDQAAAPETYSRYATFTIELSLDDAGQVRRTRVIHVQDGEERNWSGWDEGRLLRFFTVHAALEAAPATAEAAPGSIGVPGLFAALRSRAFGSAEPAGAPPDGSPTEARAALPAEQSGAGLSGSAQLKINNLIVDEAAPNHDSNIWEDVPRARARLSFRLSGPGAAQVAAQAPPCISHIVACNLANGSSILLAAGQDCLAPAQLDYTSALEFALPGDGRYQLVATIVIAQAGLVGSALGPVLHVVP